MNKPSSLHGKDPLGNRHRREHGRWSRRGFLKSFGFTAGMSMVLQHLPVNTLTASPLSFMLNGLNNDRVLVLIRLKGGNDGLNTIVPLNQYDTYINKRPDIGWSPNQLLNLSFDYAMPEVMDALYPMWQEGRMKVLHNVGYPDQNLSHFRSSDIWASASDADVEEESGWLGRLLDCQYPDFLIKPPTVPPAIQIGGLGNHVFTNPDRSSMALTIQDPEELFRIAENGELYDLDNLPPCTYGDQLGFLRAATNSTFAYAEVIKEAFDASSSPLDTYVGPLGRQLSLVARLIKGNLGTKVYLVTLDGFDTHAGQVNSHTSLLSQLANNINAFYKDLEAGGLAQNVLSMTFSEFGRRIEQNASNGTDHGAASPMLFFGEGLNGNGLIGNGPDLQNLDPIGNLIYETDFRRVYATVLEQWCCVDPDKVDVVLGRHFERVDQLGLECLDTSVSGSEFSPLIHEVRYGERRQIVLHYQLPEPGPAKIQVFNLLGQPVRTLFSGRQSTGAHQIIFQPDRSISAGPYVYRIEAGRLVGSGKISLR